MIVAGCDVGSLTSKAVVMVMENGSSRIAGSAIIRSRTNPEKTSEAVSVKMRLANSPAEAPPIPSATTHRPISGRATKASWLSGRLRPGSDMANKLISGRCFFDEAIIAMQKRDHKKLRQE